MKYAILTWLLALGICSAGTGGKIVEAARKQIGVTVSYDPSYTSLAYPGGDVPKERGVCTDVVIRALRDAIEKDLQKLVHEDMKSSFSKYPKNWGLTRPDKNIDHRRVPNPIVFFKRKHTTIPLTEKVFLPGDIVTCTVPPHIMIVSHKKNAEGFPLIIHNIGGGTREEDRFKIDTERRQIGRYLKRWGFTPQRPVKRAYECNDKAVGKWMDEEYPAIAKKAVDEGGEVHWGDETGIKSNDHQVADSPRKGRLRYCGTRERWRA